jgi:hypothetical protein
MRYSLKRPLNNNNLLPLSNHCCNNCSLTLISQASALESIPAMSGHYRGSRAFPNLPQFSGFMKPCRFEGEVQHLEIEGDLPQELDGTFYRVMPDPQFPPFVENDPVCITPTVQLPGGNEGLTSRAVVQWRWQHQRLSL